MKIGFDVDGVLADFNRNFITRVIIETGKDLFGPGFVPLVWDYPEAQGYTREEVSAVWNIIKSDRNFWATLPVYENEYIYTVADILNNRQHHGDEVYFITSRPGYKAKEQSEDWLARYTFARPTVLISSEKGKCAAALKLDVYIDDRLENVMDVAVRAPQCQTWLCNRPWNRKEQQGVVLTLPGVKRTGGAYDLMYHLFVKSGGLKCSVV